jgi:hypothetical protein
MDLIFMAFPRCLLFFSGESVSQSFKQFKNATPMLQGNKYAVQAAHGVSGLTDILYLRYGESIASQPPDLEAVGMGCVNSRPTLIPPLEPAAH